MKQSISGNCVEEKSREQWQIYLVEDKQNS